MGWGVMIRPLTLYLVPCTIVARRDPLGATGSFVAPGTLLWCPTGLVDQPESSCAWVAACWRGWFFGRLGKPQAKSHGMEKLSVQFSRWRSNTYFEWVFWWLSYFLSGDFCRCSAIMIERHFFQMGWKPHTQIRIFLANMKIPMVICIFFFNQSDTVWVDCTFSWYRNSPDNC